MTVRVSVGLPVYNGEKFVGEAIESVLGQTFADLELVICDNASTDETQTICRSYAARDERVRYYRQAENVGAARNFNRAFELSCGEYFQWTAHDDLCDRTFLAKCVDVLDGDRSVVLCYSKVRIVDEGGGVVQDYDRTLGTDVPEAHRRFRALIHGHLCYEVFGLIRRGALARTGLMGNYAHGDGVLLAQLGLCGRFRELPERLFFSRVHPGRSMSAMKDRYMFTEWFDPSKKGRLIFPHWRIFWECLRSVGKARLGAADRAWCYGHLARWLVSCRRRLARDLVLAGKQVFVGRDAGGP